MNVARSVVALVACMVLFAHMECTARVQASTEQPQGSEGAYAPKRFDIEAQALATALRAFSEASGTAVLFDNALVADRQTRGLHGEASPRDALRILLAGTGLEARFSSVNAVTVTLQASPTADTAPAPDAEPPPVLDDRAARVLQSAIERALCSHASTRPGSFRLAMQLWIDATGSVSKAIALAPSDQPARDDDVLAAVQAVRVAGTFHRFSPVTVLLAPDRGLSDPCAASREREG